MAEIVVSDSYSSRMDVLRDIIVDLWTRISTFISRADPRSSHNIYEMRLDKRWTSKRARIITTVLYTITILIIPVIVGMIYSHIYHPNTHRLLQKQN